MQFALAWFIVGAALQTADGSDVLSITDLASNVSPAEVRRLTRVSSLPTFGALSGVNLYSAYATVQSDKDAHLHFELFESDNPDAPVIVYLMGGPGVPGFGGWGIMKNMPISMHASEPRLVRCNTSWTSKAHVLWLDAPVHVGYSFADPGFFVNCTLCPNSTNDSTSHTLSAVRQVLKRFGLTYQPLHIAGLSYGGKYAPALAWKILRSKQDAQLAQRLASIMVFGSWTDPFRQLPGQVDYFLNGGLISGDAAARLKPKETEELVLIKAGRFREANALNANLTGELLALTGVAPVDVTMPLEELGSAMEGMTVLANKPEFQAALHVRNGSKWEIHDNDGPVADALGEDVMRSYFSLLPDLLRDATAPGRLQPFNLVFINGQLDSTVRALQVENMLGRAASDSGLGGTWSAALRQPWRPGGALQGTVRNGSPLHFYVMRGEGHIAGLKQPDAAQQIVQEVLALGQVPLADSVIV